MKPRVLLIKAAPKADRPSVAPPLGVLGLASVLRRELDADVRVYDAGFDMYGAAPPPVEQTTAMIEEFEPDFVGISALTCERECMIALADAAKRARPQTTVIVGGPYPTAETTAWRDAEGIDWAVIGEGDEAFPALIRAVMAGDDPEPIPGVLGRTGSGEFALAPPVADLDALPLPAWDLVDLRAYSDPKYRNQTGLPAHQTYVSLCTSRGCPFKCAYCHDVHGKKFRGVSVERVLEQVDEVVAAGAREIHFVDDIFNWDLPRAKAIFRGIAERHPKMRIAFPNGLRADQLDQEFAVEAKRAGTWYAAVAVETASPRIQKLIKKHLNLEKVRRAIGWLEGEGIRTRSFVMLGFPTETEQEMEETIRFVIDSDTSEASFFNVVPYPGSPLHDLAESEAPGAADEVTKAPFYSEESYYSKVTGRNLSKVRDRAILRFYMSRARFLKFFLRTPLRFYFSRAFLETVAYFGLKAGKSLLPRRSTVNDDAVATGGSAS